jgi:hypothetical protein
LARAVPWRLLRFFCDEDSWRLGLRCALTAQWTPAARALIFANEIVHHLGVVDLARRHPGGMHKAASRIDADVRFHPEIPLVTLLRLVSSH